MPAKRRKKTTKSKKETEETKPMPSLIFNTVEMTEEKKEQDAPSDEKKNKTQIIFPGNIAAKKYMWMGVTGFSTIIFLFWGWALIAKITHINIAKTPEVELANSAKQNWAAAFEETKLGEGKKHAMEELKKILGNLSTSTAETPSTTASTTLPASTTPTITVTSTPTTTLKTEKITTSTIKK